MKTFEFKSQICTTTEQSERLLALGLKKETADARLRWLYRYKNEDYYLPILSEIATHNDLPAWSLHRLIELLSETPLQVGSQVGIYVEDTYDMVIQGIEWLIKGGYFNKDYLEE